MRHVGTIKRALILLMHGANMKIVTLIISDEDINTAASKQAEVVCCLKKKDRS